MQLAKILEKNSFWLSMICHAIFFLSFFLVLTSYREPEKKPAMDIPQTVPSYLYHDVTSVPLQQKMQQPMAGSNTGLIKQDVTHDTSTVQKSMPTTATRSASKQQAVHLIGDKKVNKPLIQLLGKALAAHLAYPKIAIDFNLKGTVYVGFTIYPDGHITDAQLMKSSSAGVLDDAALAAVNTMGPVGNVAEYLTQPKFLVVGIIFG